MTDAPTIIANNLDRVLERIALAAQRCGRRPGDVALVGVTKYVSAEVAAALRDAGCTELGESRPQQLWEKAEHPLLGGVRWHLVGHLQRNKVRRTLPLVQMIHSVDSERLLAEIDRQAAPLQQTIDVLLEVNTSGDEVKHGVSPAELADLLAVTPKYSHVNVRGLMTMAALGGGKEVARKNFATLRELRDRVAPGAPATYSLNVLSMGMSGDFEAAIEEGATMVRIGSLLWEGIESEQGSAVK